MTTQSLVTISKAPLLGYIEPMNGIAVAKGADQLLTIMRNPAEGAIKAAEFLNRYEDFAPILIAAVERSGQAVDTMLICSELGLDPDIIGITTGTVQGQQLGMLLRQLHLFHLQCEGTRNYLMEAQEIFDSYEREDWKLAGFSAWNKFIKATRPATGVNVTQAMNRLNIFKNVKPRTDAIGIDVVHLFMALKPSVADELVSLLSNEKTLDNDGLLLVCTLVQEGIINTVSEVQELKTHPAIRVWTKFAAELRKVGMDPVERAINLGMDKLSPVAQFVTSGNVTAKLNDEVDDAGVVTPGFISQMESLALEYVIEHCQTPHSASVLHTQVVEQYDDDEDPTPSKKLAAPQTIQGAEVVQIDDGVLQGMLTAGAQDEHTRIIFDVIKNDASTGYITIEVKEQTIPVRLAQEFQRACDAEFKQHGIPHVFKSGVLVKRK